MLTCKIRLDGFKADLVAKMDFPDDTGCLPVELSVDGHEFGMLRSAFKPTRS